MNHKWKRFYQKRNKNDYAGRLVKECENCGMVKSTYQEKPNMWRTKFFMNGVVISTKKTPPCGGKND
jgi:ribosomal protein S14